MLATRELLGILAGSGTVGGEFACLLAERMAPMRPGRIISLLTVFFFSFAVLAPIPLAAAENQRASGLSAVKDFLVKDWAQTRGDLRRLGDFLDRDFARTRADVSAVHARLVSLKLATSAGDRGGRLRDRLQRLREMLADRLDATIDEMGVHQFAATVEKIAGAPIVQGAAGMDESLVRARVARSFDEAFEVVAGEMEQSGPRATFEAIREADGVVNQMSLGATPEQVVETLKTRHFGPDGNKFKDRRAPGFFSAVSTVLKTLFMLAACGAISLVSLGILSYGLATGGLLFVAAGGAAVGACLYGIIFYVADCIKRLRAAPARTPVPAPALSLEVAR